MFVTTQFQQCPEVYSAGKLPYTALFDMSGFFSEQARRALEGDNEMASHLFAADSCHQQQQQQPQPLVMSTSPSPTTTAYPYPQPAFYESQYYQVPFMAGSFDSSASVSPVSPVSPVWNSHPQQQQQQQFEFAMQRYAEDAAARQQQINPVPSYHAVPRLSHPRRHHIHNHYHQKQQHQQRHLPSSSSSSSPSITSDSLDNLSDCGVRSANGTWRCAHPGCSSKTVFTRACDLRKHYNRHRKYLFCRFDGCPQSREGGFSSKKDRARHEAKHNPQITCEWQGCGRVFSRADNMKDHVRRIHCRGR
ncbi:uncharacterized protein TRUGW13939_00393 [Talaromyces rugulosus]|uniref:C2H2-type domain-containing protein n=1 Tax=Talaromyces rugulosus TaxID=121627 RepID=A0A7H8QIP7_TALRU|nr:uncharacterized protein TRUGW13939_00393 [Talaromyces rugulosus]QKX53315.1 hypothetical protein TRUGW13939_00393 [Talaromyces rugulosus]